MSKFPDKIYCNVHDAGGEGENAQNVYAYLTLETAAEGEFPVRVGIYQLIEVAEVRVVTSVETVKVEN